MNRSTAEIEADLAATRSDLAEVIDALSDKLDVTANLRASAHDPATAVRDHWKILAVAGSAAVLAVLVVRRGRK